MPRKPPRETPVERIFREVSGYKMPASIRRILLPKQKGHRALMDSSVDELRSDEWINTLADGRRVKFTNQEIENDWAFITAQVEGNKVVYSVVLTNANNPLSRGEVTSHFEDELSKKSPKPN
jgi:hypothetical protein